MLYRPPILTNLATCRVRTVLEKISQVQCTVHAFAGLCSEP